MDGRKRVYGLPITIPKELPLHGFLRCPKCNRSLTGSASRGKQKYHVYYHCTSSCGIRFRAQLVNASFESELSLFAPVQGMAELFAYAIADSHIEQTGGRTSERKALNKQVDEINTKLSRARDLLMDGAIAADDFKEMKSSCLLKLLRIEAKQLQMANENKDALDIQGISNQAMRNLMHLNLFFSESDVEGQRLLISRLFPDKLTFDGEKH